MYLNEIEIENVVKKYGYSETFFLDLPKDIREVLIENFFNIIDDTKQNNKFRILRKDSKATLDLIIESEMKKKEKVKALIKR